EYVFAGTNTDSPVMPADPAQSGSAPATAFETAFQAQFGFSTASPSVANITAAQISGFLQSNMPSLFDPSAWKANWSSASDSAMQARIEPDQTAQTSLSGNDPAFAQMAQAYSILTQLPLASMNSSAVSAAVAGANSVANAGLQSLTQAQLRVGAMQSGISNANTLISSRTTALASGIAALDPVDPYATSTKIAQLQTQLQMAYSLTAQLQHLSLAQYL
ncbi:MAG TPA: flagellin, partial [Burkholderiales bacterium]|nr:flagellin [Burkholderiales bacterium]